MRAMVPDLALQRHRLAAFSTGFVDDLMFPRKDKGLDVVPMTPRPQGDNQQADPQQIGQPVYGLGGVFRRRLVPTGFVEEPPVFLGSQDPASASLGTVICSRAGGLFLVFPRTFSSRWQRSAGIHPG